MVVILKRLGCTKILLDPLADETLEGLSDENKDMTLLITLVCVLIKEGPRQTKEGIYGLTWILWKS